jgi:hypothetical protein
MGTHRVKTRDLCVEIQNKDFSVTVEECQPLSVIGWTKLTDNNLTSWRSWVKWIWFLTEARPAWVSLKFFSLPPTNPSLPCTASVSIELWQSEKCPHFTQLIYESGLLRIKSWCTPTRTVVCRFHTEWISLKNPCVVLWFLIHSDTD